MPGPTIADADSALQTAGYEPDAPERWESTLAEMTDLISAELQTSGIKQDIAGLAARLACRLCEAMGGRMYYIPRGASLERARRDLEIFTTHDGTRLGPNGVHALARRHGLSEIYVYRILARQLEMRRGKSQAELKLNPG